MKEKILRIIQKIFLPLEISAIVLISLRFFMDEEVIVMTSMGYILLAALYFISAYFEAPQGLTRLAMFSKRILGIALSISVVGVYFAFMHLPGARMLLMIGVTTTVLSLIITLVEILRKAETANLVRFSVIRGLLISIFTALVLYFTDFGS